MKKCVLCLLLLSLLAAPSFAEQVIPGDVLVVFENPSHASKVSAASMAAPNGEHRTYIASVAESMNAKVAFTYDVLSENSDSIIALIHSDTKNERELLEDLLSRPDIKGASLNYMRSLTATPDDRYYSVYPDSNGKLWGLKAINADKLWAQGHTGSDSVYVAVIDSGIDSGHPDLISNIAKEYCTGYEIISQDADSFSFKLSNEEATYQDDPKLGHGTHVSGIIGAAGNNEIGVTGVGWNTKIIMLNAYMTFQNGTSTFPDSLIIADLEKVLQLKKDGVNIAALNMSMGGWDSKETPEAISQEGNVLWSVMKAISDLDVVICVSAGNESQKVGYPAPYDDPYGRFSKDSYIYPASYLYIDNMIVVAAASQDKYGNIIRSAEGVSEAGSNYGSEYVDIAAPGSHIVSTVPRDYVVPHMGKPYRLGDLDEHSELVEKGVNEYASWPGTSMAAPYVAGAVALLKAAYPNATAAEIKQALLDGANGNYCKDDADTVTYMDGLDHPADSTSRYGFLDVKKAYDLLAGNNNNNLGNSSSGGCDSGLGGLVILGLAGAIWVIKKLSD